MSKYIYIYRYGARVNSLSLSVFLFDGDDDDYIDDNGCDTHINNILMFYNNNQGVKRENYDHNDYDDDD